MLTRDQARERIAEWRADPPTRPGALARLRHPASAALVQLLDTQYRPDGRPIAPDRRQLAADLDALTPARRTKVFAGFAPGLAPDIERWWTWATTAPFQVGFERRPFRSPDPVTSREARLAALTAVLDTASRYPEGDATWFARWGAYADSPWSPCLGPVLAAAISAGRTGVRDALIDCALGRDELGGMGPHVVTGLLSASDPVGWEVVENLLVAAQRQEGLRQTVLEAVDLAHPEAFVRMLGVVAEQRLTRFAATVRAVSVWLGEGFEARQDALVLDVVGRLRRLLTSPPSEAEVSRCTDPAELFLSLWCLAFRDVLAAVRVAGPLLGSPDADVRHAATRFLVGAGLMRTYEVLTPALADPDPRVLALAVHHYAVNEYGNVVQDAPPLDDAQVDNLLTSLSRLGRVETVEVGVLGQHQLKIGASTVADRLVVFAPPEATPRLGPAFDKAGAGGRRVRVERLTADPVANRAALLEHVGDPAQTPRALATQALLTSGIRLGAQEAPPIEALLTRTASDLRRACLELLRTQSAEGVAASVQRLEAGTGAQQDAARDLSGRARTETLDAMAPPGGPPVTMTTGTATSARAAASASAPWSSSAERDVLLVDDARRTPSQRPPVPRTSADHAATCTRLVTSLIGWLDENRDVEVRVGSEVKVLADVSWLPHTAPGEPLPLAEVLDPWWDRVRPGLTDGGLECALVSDFGPLLAEREYFRPPSWVREAAARVIGRGCAPVAEHHLALGVLASVARREQRASWLPAMLDAHASLLAQIPGDYFTASATRRRHDAEGPVRSWLPQDDPRTHVPLSRGLVGDLVLREDVPTSELARWWAMARFLDEPGGRHVRGTDPMTPSAERARSLGVGIGDPAALTPLRAPRALPPPRLVALAHEAGVATPDDVVDHVLTNGGNRYSSLLAAFTARLPEPWVRDSPRTQEVLGPVRERVLAVEVARGEFATETTEVAQVIRHVPGIDWFVTTLRALGRGRLVRGYLWRGGRDSALCRILRVTGPLPGETADDLATAARGAKLSERRLVEVGVYAPQWAALLEDVIGWPGYADAVWWLHAHTKGEDWTVDAELRSEWAAQVSRRTPLDATDLTRGAVDVRWFHEVLATLGEERFDVLLSAAKYGSTAGGHKRAELFAASLLGRTDAAALLERVRSKRHQDSVRALGLLPLPEAEDTRDDEVLRRYEVLSGFVASDRSSGSQRRASEATAVEVGLENLARTAGYTDPQRLVWAMEAHAVRDLADGPLTVVVDDLTVSLSVSDDGDPELEVSRGGRPLASLPRAAAKDPAIAELRSRVGTLRAQVRRMRHSLERACVDGERFTPAELREMDGHPLLRPMLRDLVLVGDCGEVGFASPDPAVLVGADGSAVAVRSGGLRIAHPVDLLEAGTWPDLQRVLFTAGRRQPFRQLFRELYTVTEAERDAVDTSHRYAGHQVQPRQAGALFRTRGWVVDPEVGFTRTFHRERLTVVCAVLGTFLTPGEVEDATLETVTFHATRTGAPVALTDVPARLFSEVMRDLDLVVSVAHSGGVDPETSASSVEVRGRLVDETCDLLGLTNVETTDHHALIKGSIASYSVNLGSGVVHRQPGASVCVVPVSAQHRGRVFLPFVDDDPRTAEVVSKVVLLARDHDIKDPTILAQLR